MRALVLVDLQNDFMPFGSLPVAEGDLTVGVANRLMGSFELVVATQDWHPRDHGSFASNHPGSKAGEITMLGGVEQVLWPDHCVQNTPGASFHSALDVAAIDHVVHKGTNREIDSYSTFFDNAHGAHTGLDAFLKERGVDEVVLSGLATDYCVLYSVLDAAELGYRVTVVRDGCRAVELKTGDGDRAFASMADAGASIIESSQLLR
ncbi:MAG: bifunctional nicotinamidase/pyrazinamidase [Coriobacteriales bacterium]|nr:bifunctional nicotinamidase/pyrazinamidase [Coriobacteriales bacterium]